MVNRGFTYIKFMWKTFIERFFCMKVGIIFVLLFFIEHIFLSPFKQYCSTVNYNISPVFFPFLISDLYFQIIFSTIVIYFFSNVPFMQKYGMYHIIRMGRVKWAFGQIGSIILCAIGLISIMFLESILILFPKIQFDTTWGKVIHTLALADLSEQFQMQVAIPYKFLKDYTPIKALAITFFVSIMIVVFIGLLMFVISLFGSRILAIIAACTFIVAPIISKNIFISKQLLFSYFSPISWLQVTRLSEIKYGYQILVPLSYVLPVLSLLNLILCIIVVLRIKKVEFQWSDED